VERGIMLSSLLWWDGRGVSETDSEVAVVTLILSLVMTRLEA
jgi:hypothetical protein